ncbi:MAG: hypothetical protein L0211_20235 [Planctomycetaceae bacterium]|nr:hypothetical protein [Planctomycetaceae bacterium]
MTNDQPMTSLLLTLIFAADPAAAPFAIEVLDEQTGRGVPLVELTTTSGVSYFTDSAGLAAFDEPGLMNQRVFFSVNSHGYAFSKDAFGIRGISLEVKPGGSAQLKIKRLNIAERLYRVTGQGIYRDSVLLGRDTPIKEPLLNAQVTGCDSVVNAVYQGRIYWFWGDTNQAGYLLGNFNVPGATSPTVASGTVDPDRGIDLAYFVGEKGFARPVCKMPGDGPTWINGLAALKDAGGRERLLCGYVKIKAPMTVYRRGMAIWNDETSQFDHLRDYEPDVPLFPDGHPLLHRDGDTEFLYFATSAPLVRVKATAESYQDLGQYEAFTCLKTGTSLAKSEIDRGRDGRARYAWKQNTPPVGVSEQARLVKDGLLKPEEGLLQLRDVATGTPIVAHNNSCAAWNEHRKKWTNILLQVFGTSILGEIWYAEADSPLGPWVYATKIVTHDKYSFYNPKQHPILSRKGSRFLYFEGTYTHTFSGAEHRTPRYDYNQLMYRLDLDDPRLALPVAVYDAKGRGYARDLRLRDVAAANKAPFETIRFFALDRPREGGALAICAVGNALRGVLEPGPTDTPLFYALPTDTDVPGITVPLYEYLGDNDAPPILDVRGDLEIAGYRRCPEPLGRVWPSPYSKP